jgi:uncharacterized membrane protein
VSPRSVREEGKRQAPPAESTSQSFREGDLTASTNKDSPGRLLVLSDGVFAIALTLLALDLHVPDVGSSPSNRALDHALAAQSSSYLSFLISFYVVAGYWARHRRLMRSVESIDASLIQYTLFLLLCVAALPFPAALLGKYGSHPISLAIYGGLNALASLDLVLLHRTVQRHHLGATSPEDRALATSEMLELIGTMIVFLICIPAAYLFDGSGAWVLVLLIVVQRWRSTKNHINRLLARKRARAAASA